MANDKAAEIAGKAREELIGLSYLSFFCGRGKKAVPGIRKELHRQGSKHDFQTVLQRHTGEKVPVEASFSVIRNESGVIEGYLSVFRDITNRKMADEERKRLEDELLEIVFKRLSDREIEFLKVLAGGLHWPKQKRDIGKIMDVLPGTLDQFMGRIKKKMETYDIEKIAAIAVRRFKRKAQIKKSKQK